MRETAMLETRFTKTVGCSVPVQLAAMGGVVTPELVCAVSNAGGLGMIGAVMIPPPLLAELLDAIREGTSAPFGAGFLVPFLDRDSVAVAAQRCRVVEFFYAEPDPALVASVHEHEALAFWQVGSAAEAAAAVRAGCDVIVAQGVEAGGHLRGERSTLTLLAEVLDAVDVPVIAAGGVGTARGMAAALAAGASAVRVGTRFLAAEEADTHASWLELLIRAEATDTVVTRRFGASWPDAPHRVLRSAIAAAEAWPDDPVAEMEHGGRKVPIPRFDVPCPNRSTHGRIEAMALYAGESVGAVRGTAPAASIVRELADGAEELLRRW